MQKKERKICHVRNFTFYVKSKGFLSKVHFAIETYFYEETWIQLESFSFAKWIAKRNWKFFLVVKPVEKSIGIMYSIEIAATTIPFFDWFYWIHIFLLMDIWEDGSRKSEYGIGTNMVFFHAFKSCWNLQVWLKSIFSGHRDQMVLEFFWEFF